MKSITSGWKPQAFYKQTYPFFFSNNYKKSRVLLTFFLKKPACLIQQYLSWINMWNLAISSTQCIAKQHSCHCEKPLKALNEKPGESGEEKEKKETKLIPQPPHFMGKTCVHHLATAYCWLQWTPIQILASPARLHPANAAGEADAVKVSPVLRRNRRASSMDFGIDFDWDRRTAAGKPLIVLLPFLRENSLFSLTFF